MFFLPKQKEPPKKRACKPDFKPRFNLEGGVASVVSGKKIITIKENSDFRRAYYRGKSIVKKRIVLYFRKNKFSYNRLGITVSPKVGNSVVRNRIRRLIRENYRLSEISKSGYDIVIVARSSAAYSNYYGIGKDLKSAFQESGFCEK